VHQDEANRSGKAKASHFLTAKQQHWSNNFNEPPIEGADTEKSAARFPHWNVVS